MKREQIGLEGRKKERERKNERKEQSNKQKLKKYRGVGGGWGGGDLSEEEMKRVKEKMIISTEGRN